MRKKYCKYCGLELEAGKCICELSKNANDKKVAKVKCDTCKESIDKDSLYCPFCGIPQFVDGKNKNLEKELMISQDVMKIYFGARKKRFPYMIILIIIAILILLCVIFYFRSKPNVPEGLTEDASTERETSIESLYKDMWIKKDGVYYCFDKDGNPVVDDWVTETNENGEAKKYYFDIDGKLVVNSWVGGEYYVDNNGEMLVDTNTPDGAKVGKDGKVIVTLETTSKERAKQVILSDGGEIKGISKDKVYDISMESLVKISETYDKVKLVYFVPKVTGKNSEEINNINTLIFENFSSGKEFSTYLKKIIDSNKGKLNSIEMTTYEQRQVTKDKYMFLVHGKIYPKKGMAEKLKYRITYNRKNNTITIMDISE